LCHIICELTVRLVGSSDEPHLRPRRSTQDLGRRHANADSTGGAASRSRGSCDDDGLVTPNPAAIGCSKRSGSHSLPLCRYETRAPAGALDRLIEQRPDVAAAPRACTSHAQCVRRTPPASPRPADPHRTATAWNERPHAASIPEACAQFASADLARQPTPAAPPTATGERATARRLDATRAGELQRTSARRASFRAPLAGDLLCGAR
jgi:hypothetical protein